MSLNRVCLVGRLTRDVESKFTPTGIQVASVGIACDRFTKNKDTGERDVDFFNLTLWRKSAEFATNYLTKGRLVSIDGRLQQRYWVDQSSGQKHSVVEVVVDNIQGLDKKPDGAGDDPSGPTPPASTAQAQHEDLDAIDESDPFSE